MSTSRVNNLFRAALANLLVASVLALGGCSRVDRDGLTPPRVLVAPYDTTQREVVWAVAPLRNESGTSLAEPDVMTDRVAAAIAEIRGVRVLPVNRSMAAMKSLQITEINTPAEAASLAAALNADALVVGTITAYNPYYPAVGLTLALYARTDRVHVETTQTVDAARLRRTASLDETGVRSSLRGNPVAVTSEHLDGRNHQVQMDVRNYAIGRQAPGQPLRWKSYIESAPLFAEFASHAAVGKLVQSEWVRIARQSRPAGRSVPVPPGSTTTLSATSPHAKVSKAGGD
ncbi:MAG: hypothetical protein SFZ23_11230 [Planctomycetota bacterium]|nr:hypothetical protein [Planctomycetota bacterium]